MHFDATRTVLAAAVVCAVYGAGCNDVVKVAPADPQPPLGEVWGQVLAADGVPTGNAPPLWIGEQSTTAAVDGTFRFTGVQGPYDLAIGRRNLQPSDQHDTIVYEGATCSKPVARTPFYNYDGYAGSAWVTGRVPYVAQWRTRIIAVTSDGRAEYDWAHEISGAYDLRVQWGHGATNRVTLYALRYDRANVLRDHYVRSFSLKNDERRVVDLEHVTFSPASTVFLNGSIRAEPHTWSRAVYVLVDFGRDRIDIGSTQASARFPDAFSLDVPYFPGAVYDVEVRASWHDEDAYYNAVERVAAVRPGSPIHATLRPGPRLFSPPDGTSGIPLEHSLRWFAQGSLGIYRLRIRGYAAGWSRTAVVYTARTVIALTEIPALQGFMRPGTTYFWSVDQLPAFGTVDDVLAGGDPEANRCWSGDVQFSTTSAAPLTPLSADLPED